MIGQSYYVFVTIFDICKFERRIFDLFADICPRNKSVRLKRFHESHYNPFQSSSGLSSRLSFCVCCVIYTCFSSFELLLLFHLVWWRFLPFKFLINLCDTAPLGCLLLPITAMAVPL